MPTLSPEEKIVRRRELHRLAAAMWVKRNPEKRKASYQKYNRSQGAKDAALRYLSTPGGRIVRYHINRRQAKKLNEMVRCRHKP